MAIPIIERESGERERESKEEEKKKKILRIDKCDFALNLNNLNNKNS